MSLKSLTYTSHASLDLDAADVERIQRTARELNALDGTTGLLIFNGTHFLQVIEGTPEAIDDLVERLRRDPRHHGLEIRDQRSIEERSFPSWSMELVHVSSDYFEAQDRLSRCLPESLRPVVRDRIVKMTEAISGDVNL